MSLDLTFTVRKKDSGEIVNQIQQKSGVALVYNREADLLLRIAKLRIVDQFGNFDKEKYSRDSGRRILVIKKNEAEDVQ